MTTQHVTQLRKKNSVPNAQSRCADLPVKEIECDERHDNACINLGVINDSLNCIKDQG